MKKEDVVGLAGLVGGLVLFLVYISQDSVEPLLDDMVYFLRNGLPALIGALTLSSAIGLIVIILGVLALFNRRIRDRVKAKL